MASLRGSWTPKPDFDGDIDYAPLWAGESVSAVNDILLAVEIFSGLREMPNAVLAEANQLR
jgi:hypothetical protein